MSETTALNPKAAASRRARLARDTREAKRRRDLVTPEGARLELKIANASERAGAFLIDLSLQFLSILIGVLIIAFATSRMGFQGWQIGWALASVLVFFLRNFYFIAFELGRRAATPGKRALGLRVAARSGGRLTANAVFARNFMREVEVFLPLTFLTMGGDSLNATIGLMGLIWSGIFLLFPIFNKDKLRIGDLIAGTWVIHAPKAKLLPDIAAVSPSATPGVFNFSPAQIDAYGIHELHVLEDVLRRSPPEVKAAVAERIRAKIGWTAQPGEEDLPFLEAYYAGLRRRLEQRMLLGDKKADKFDS